MTDEDTLNKIRSFLTIYRERLKEHKQILKRYRKTPSEPNKEDILNTFDELIFASNKSFQMLEQLFIQNSGLKHQITILQDALLKLPDINNNPSMYQEIQDNFTKYEEIYFKQMKSYLRGIDEERKSK